MNRAVRTRNPCPLHQQCKTTLPRGPVRYHTGSRATTANQVRYERRLPADERRTGRESESMRHSRAATAGPASRLDDRPTLGVSRRVLVGDTARWAVLTTVLRRGISTAQRLRCSRRDRSARRNHHQLGGQWGHAFRVENGGRTLETAGRIARRGGPPQSPTTSEPV